MKKPQKLDEKSKSKANPSGTVVPKSMENASARNEKPEKKTINSKAEKLKTKMKSEVTKTTTNQKKSSGNEKSNKKRASVKAAKSASSKVPKSQKVVSKEASNLQKSSRASKDTVAIEPPASRKSARESTLTPKPKDIKNKTAKPSEVAPEEPNPDQGFLKNFGKTIFRLFHGRKTKVEPPTFTELIQVPEELHIQPKPLEDEDYFHGFLMDNEVEPMFEEEDEGTFLVRRAQTYCGMEYLLSVQGEDDFYNVLINVTSERRLYWIDVHAFKSIQQLVEFYVDSQIPFKVYNSETKKDVVLTIKTPLKRFSWQIKHEQIELDEVLGSGQFGEVYKGYLELSFGQGRVMVAVKMMKGDNLTTQQKKDLIREADNMKKLLHKNIVRFYGIATSKDPFMMALEFCHGGTLEERLKETQTTDHQKVRFLYHAALGMEYLHDVGIVHGDLAARNCLLTKKDSVKIADFGLSANKDGAKQRDGMLPQRYMSPEAVENMLNTKESDVWAFSVLIFEVFHRGFGPFDEYLPFVNIMHYVKRDEIHMYLFHRPKVEMLPEGMYVDTASWYRTLDRPQDPILQKRIEILFKHLRFRNVKYRPKFPIRSETNRRKSVIGVLSGIMKDFEIKD